MSICLRPEAIGPVLSDGTKHNSVEKGAHWLEAGHTSEAADSRLHVSIEATEGLQVCREGLVWVSHLGRN